MILKSKPKFNLVLLLFFSFIHAQKTMTWKLTNPQLANSKAIDSSLNYLQNTASLENLFEKLYVLKTTSSNNKIIFSHIGDSHIQADKITAVIRNKFQNYFGNAGRGVIYPHRVAKTNGADEVFSSSEQLWQNSRLSKLNPNVACGITGHGIKTNNALAEIKIELKDTVKNNFDQVTLFYGKGIKQIAIETDNKLDTITIDSASQFIRYQMPSIGSKFKIKLEPVANKPIGFFGAAVSKKSESGIIYNAIGANGAKVSDYNQAPLFWEQLPELKTDCFIISLGTNEAQNQNLTSDQYTIELQTMVKNIKNSAPEATIIVFSPPVSYYKKTKPNKILPIISVSIKDFCIQNNLVFWDFFQISKGSQGTAAWRKYKLLNTDLVHFTNVGYALQGALFSTAFANAYNEFVFKKQPKTEDK